MTNEFSSGGSSSGGPSSGDYYSYHPTRSLERPLALVTFPGDEHRRLGHSLASRTGVPFVDVDRWIEHEAGQSLTELALGVGEPAFRQLEAAQLRRALSSRPAGILVLGDGSLLLPESRSAVLETALLVHLERDLSSAYWQFRQLEGRQQPVHPFLVSPLQSIDELRPAFDARSRSYGRAHRSLSLAEKSQRQLFGELRQILDSLSESV